MFIVYSTPQQMNNLLQCWWKQDWTVIVFVDQKRVSNVQMTLAKHLTLKSRSKAKLMKYLQSLKRRSTRIFQIAWTELLSVPWLTFYNWHQSWLFLFLQYFTLNSKGEIKSEDNCLDFNGYDLYLRECDNLGQNQAWEYKVIGIFRIIKTHLA